jgi:hypothetical protein
MKNPIRQDGALSVGKYYRLGRPRLPWNAVQPHWPVQFVNGVHGPKINGCKDSASGALSRGSRLLNGKPGYMGSDSPVPPLDIMSEWLSDEAQPES